MGVGTAGGLSSNPDYPNSSPVNYQDFVDDSNGNGYKSMISRDIASPSKSNDEFEEEDENDDLY